MSNKAHLFGSLVFLFPFWFDSEMHKTCKLIWVEKLFMKVYGDLYIRVSPQQRLVPSVISMPLTPNKAVMKLLSEIVGC